jgi:hypothetical protein
VWSVSHSLQRAHLCASASDDGTVQLWGGAAMHQCTAVLRPARGAPATGVHLSPFDGNLAAVSCADHNAYLYDLRRADTPLLQLSGHTRAVSYVRWMSPTRLATASTDASLAVWQLPGAGLVNGWMGELQQGDGGGGRSSACEVLTQPWKRLRGHRNSKNFVGLSVRPEDGLVACGSEVPACFAYHENWAAPLAMHAFGAAQQQQAPPAALPGDSGNSGARGSSPAAGRPLSTDQFCSAVCWQPATARLGGAPVLAAAMSNGDVRVLELQRPPLAAAPQHGI